MKHHNACNGQEYQQLMAICKSLASLAPLFREAERAANKKAVVQLDYGAIQSIVRNLELRLYNHACNRPMDGLSHVR